MSATITTNQPRNTVGQLECKPVKECDFYLQFLEEDIPGLSKKAIDSELKRQECGLNIHGEVEKGKSNLLTFWVNE